MRSWKSITQEKGPGPYETVTRSDWPLGSARRRWGARFNMNYRRVRWAWVEAMQGQLKRPRGAVQPDPEKDQALWGGQDVE